MIDKNQKITVNKETGRVHVETVNKEPSMTQQQFKEECDINNIMKKYSTTGEFTHLTRKGGQYADFSEITDYQTMLDTVRYAEEAFASLPAEVRKKFSNNPGDLIAYLQDPNNREEAITLGLVEKPKVNNEASNDDKKLNTNDDNKPIKKQKTKTPGDQEE